MVSVYHNFREDAFRYLFSLGNDTIDPYPLIPAEGVKILCITDTVFQSLKLQYQAFRQHLAGHPKKNSFNTEQIQKNFPRKKRSSQRSEHFSAYGPSTAIAVNECDYRRWCRVSEWFNQYGPDAEY